MRKVLLMALCFLVFGSTAFALDMVIGGGGLFGWAKEKYHNNPKDDPSYIHDVDATVFGGFVFFGLNRYMEASIAVYAGNNEYVDTPGGPGEALSTQVGVSLFFKRPFDLGKYFVIFPTLGLDAQNNVGGLDLWLCGGLGMDIFFGERLFLRAQGIYRAGALMLYKGSLNEYTETEFPAHGPLFKLGLGWMY